MTGHLIFGKYNFHKNKNEWIPDKNERKELYDPYNRFIHFVFSFSNSQNQLVFCDTRKFGKITIFETSKLKELDHELNKLGPEPLDNNFTFKNFEKQINGKSGKIKTILMDQTIISGIGNIYSDEMLWLASIHPESNPKKIPNKDLKLLFSSMKKVLLKGIKFGGDSTSDYRNIDGARGQFQGKHNVYRKKNEKCGKKGCLGVIIRKVVNGRSAHFCNLHQKIF
jgi:formamidopyrimidine-DNA glycosylase